MTLIDRDPPKRRTRGAERAERTPNRARDERRQVEAPADDVLESAPAETSPGDRDRSTSGPAVDLARSLWALGGRAVGRWREFWFGPISGAVPAAYRVSLGLLNLYWVVTLMQDLDWFFGTNPVDARTSYAGPIWGLLDWLDAEQWAGPLTVAAAVASLGLITGKFVQISGIALAIISTSLFRENTMIWNAGDGLLRILNMLFAASCVLMPRRALSTPLFGVVDANGNRSWPAVPSFLVRLTQIQLTVIYLSAIIEKIPGEPWRDGTGGAMALKLETMQRFWAPDFLTENLLMANLITWSALGLEIALPFLLWTKRTRLFAIVAGIGMHAAFDYGLFLGIFSYVMYVAYVAFFPPAQTERLLRWIADKVSQTPVAALVRGRRHGDRR